MAFTLRLPAAVDAALKKEAAAEKRSKQDQIITILEERYRASLTNMELHHEAKKPRPLARR